MCLIVSGESAHKNSADAISSGHPRLPSGVLSIEAVSTLLSQGSMGTVWTLWTVALAGTGIQRLGKRRSADDECLVHAASSYPSAIAIPRIRDESSATHYATR